MNQERSESSSPLRPVYLVTSEDDAAAKDGAAIGRGEVLTGVVVALAVVLMVVIVVGSVRRRRDAARPAEDVALRGMCRRLRLGRAERSALDALASADVEGWPRRVHPVALLVSRGAFETAAAASVREGAVSAAAVNRIRRRAFRG